MTRLLMEDGIKDYDLFSRLFATGSSAGPGYDLPAIVTIGLVIHDY